MSPTIAISASSSKEMLLGKPDIVIPEVRGPLFPDFGMVRAGKNKIALSQAIEAIWNGLRVSHQAVATRVIRVSGNVASTVSVKGSSSGASRSANWLATSVAGMK